MACDLRYAGAAPALRISQPELLVGIALGGGGSQRMVRMLGTARALEHMLEAVPLTAPEALALGLVHRVIPEQRLLAEAQAPRLARRAPISVKALKRAYLDELDRLGDTPPRRSKAVDRGDASRHGRTTHPMNLRVQAHPSIVSTHLARNAFAWKPSSTRWSMVRVT
jgi:enoyl-CoA hydratase/carnithine racemase